MRQQDVIIIGGGHNGLVAAAYLAAGGLSVKVLERQPVVGGAAVTEEFHPGFRNSVASYTVSLLSPKIIADLELSAHGLRIVDRKVQNLLPLPDGRVLRMHLDAAATRAEVARFSTADAARLGAFGRRLDRIAEIVRRLWLKTPANPGRGLGGWLPALEAAGLAHGLDRESQRDLLELVGSSAGDVLDRWFESEPIKAVLGFDSIVGNYGSPYSPGSAYVLLHHVVGEVNGRRGGWGHALGGMGAITQAMARAVAARGGEIETGAAVAEVLTERGRAAGVVLADGRVLRARAVVSNLNPKLLFRDLIDQAVVPADFAARMQAWRCRSGTFRMNVALDRLPEFTAAPNRDGMDHLTAGIILAPSLGYMDRAYADARAFGWSREPIVEMLIPSTLDDSLAPPGRHVASLFCQHVAPELPDGRSWDDARETVADLMLDTVERYAPGFRVSVLGRQILSPLDLERRFGLLGGDIFHGQLVLDQLWAARPTLGFGDYRTPVPGLYQCGSGTHPGGGVSGAPGHNAAREILRDFRRGRLGRP
ncbi:MAG TPA: NAD(P)/FAD-dependent oxidoreductase [Aliidongia sp.]|uniref:phytoene desaturase family protein n=1 Tax=Aliidongia sp. TaxID=1914230 RepID=UPI002DDD7BB9|nr:NAD(P)/FAD-dependent oxidoreductase [Aliidongia sp.]HEV2677112.1 NAD(P)/FAD-dependent oxidoreductase [Aliidongia sp.]